MTTSFISIVLIDFYRLLECDIFIFIFADNISPEAPHREVKNEIDHLDTWFHELVWHLQSDLSNNTAYNLDKLQCSVIHLPLSVRRDHHQFIMMSAENIDNAGDIKELFRYLNIYWSFLEYSLLDLIIQRNSPPCSDELKQEMENYKEKVESFKKHTTVEQLLECDLLCGDDNVEPPPNFSKVVTKLEGKAFKYTLEEIDCFRQRFCHQLNLRTFLLKLVLLKPGSLGIVWHIPTSEVHHIIHASLSTLRSISADLIHLEVDHWNWSRLTSGEFTS